MKSELAPVSGVLAIGAGGTSAGCLRLVGAAAALFVMAGPMVAHAQSVGMPGGSGMGGGGMGAPSLGGVSGKPLTIGVRERTTYDSGAAQGNNLAAALRGLHQADITYSPALTIDYASQSTLRGIALAGTIGYDYHQRNPDLSRESINVSGLAHATFGSCGTVANLNYVRAQSGLQNQTLLVTKNTLQTAGVSVGENCGTPTGLTESVSTNYSVAQNSDSGLIDSHSAGVSASVGYSNATLGSLSTAVNFNKVSYDNAPMKAAANTPGGFHVASVGLQFSRPIGARLQGQVGAFYSSSGIDGAAASATAQAKAFTGLTANAALTYKVGPRLLLRTSFARVLQPSISQTAAYAVNTIGTVNADYTLSSRIRVFLGGSWSREDYRGRDTSLKQIAPTQVDLKSATAGMSFQLGRHSTVSADVHHQESKTDLALFNYKSDRVSLTLATSF